MSPRRSSRTRTLQAPSNNNGSSSSSVASNRQDLSASHPIPATVTHMASVTPPSESEGPERSQPHEPETRQTRRQKREQNTLDGVGDKVAGRDVEEEDAEEEEVTRCVCSQLEYPGAPVPIIVEASRSQQPKENQREGSQSVLEPLPEDAGSLFIQCDECHVWQHGGCVGIMDEATSPDNYYCEECRSDLHRIMIDARGQKYSRYLPLYEPMDVKTPRRPSASNSKDSYSRSSKEDDLSGGTAAQAMSSAKRRSTMNSRAAVDEEEAFLKAIEESKSDGTTGNGTRKTKRGRDEASDEIKQDLKRRKTNSESDSPTLAQAGSTVALSDSEAANNRGTTSSGRRKARGAAEPVLHRDRDTREREKEKYRERAEAAGRRKGRAEKRRTDEPEIAEEPSRPAGSSRGLAAGKQARSQAPTKASPNPALPTTSTTQRKGVKPAPKRGRVGRNQYTKERDAALESKGGSPPASHSRDSEEMVNSDGPAGSTLVNGTKPAKVRQMNNRTSMNDLRKRAAGILEYISRTQVEMAGDKTPQQKEDSSPGPVVTNGSKTRAGTAAMTVSSNGASKLSHQVDGTSEENGEEKKGEEEMAVVKEGKFKELSSLQMMDILTRELVLWQKDYGKWGEK